MVIDGMPRYSEAMEEAPMKRQMERCEPDYEAWIVGLRREKKEAETALDYITQIQQMKSLYLPGDAGLVQLCGALYLRIIALSSDIDRVIQEQAAQQKAKK